jgi:hypothetical protein
LTGAGAELVADRRIRFQLRAAGDAIPSDTDPETVRLLLPLLGRGASRTLLIGRLAVGMGLDTATSIARVDQLLRRLVADGLVGSSESAA